MNSDVSKRVRNSFLLSLILHILLAFMLGHFLLEQPQEKAMESVAVDMVEARKRVVPSRRMEMRESVSDLRELRKEKAATQFKPWSFRPVDTDSDIQSGSPDARTVFPELATNADRLKSRFDAPLPRPTGAAIMKPGTGTREGTPGGGSGVASIGLPGEAGIFETALYWIAHNIVSKNKTGKEDIVFLIDASGTMDENIAGVARYISRMIDVFKESGLDYTIGVIKFNFDVFLKKNENTVYAQTRDVNRVKAILRSIKCVGDERAFDAMEVGLTQVEFRHPADKTFILATDEPFRHPRTSTRQTLKGVITKEVVQEDFREIVEMCKNAGVKVNVLGIEDEMHKSLAKETGGLWFQIPQQEGLP